MKDYILEFPNHLLSALQIGNRFECSDLSTSTANVLIAGLGGSGIGGKIVSQLVADKVQIPVCITHDYEIPIFVNEKTLLIACSYSGNTEESGRAHV
jgi:glucose/mannose-6-phosphate isomerase